MGAILLDDETGSERYRVHATALPMSFSDTVDATAGPVVDNDA